MRSFLLLISSLGLCALPLEAQSPSRVFREDLLFPSAYTSRIAVDSTGHLYACSGSSLVGFLNTSVHWFQTKRLDPAGNVLWTRDYRPPGGFSERAYWLAVDSQDNVVVVGFAMSQQSAARDVVVLRYSPDGVLLHETRWNGGLAGSIGYKVVVGPQDEAYVQAAGAGAGGILQLLRVSPSGNLDWVRGLTPQGGTLVNVASGSLTVSPLGVVAYTAGIVNTDFFTACYDPGGNLLWSDQFSSGLGGGRDIKADALGNFYVCGAGVPAGGTVNSGVILKYDASGNRTWELGFNSPGSLGAWDSFARLAIDPQGGVVAVGQAQGLYRNWVVVKVTSGGSILWSDNYDGFSANDEFGVDVVVDDVGAVYACGSAGTPVPVPGNCTPPGFSGDVESTVVKWDASGARVWVETVPCSGQPTAITRDVRGGLAVATPGEIVRWLESPEILITQAGGALAGVSVLLSGLNTGNAYRSVFSLEPAPGGIGTGPYAGLFASDPNTLVAQLLLPFETPPFAVTATSAQFAVGPLSVPPGLRIEAVLLDATLLAGGTLSVSPAYGLDVH